MRDAVAPRMAPPNGRTQDRSYESPSFSDPDRGDERERESRGAMRDRDDRDHGEPRPSGREIWRGDDRRDRSERSDRHGRGGERDPGEARTAERDWYRARDRFSESDRSMSDPYRGFDRDERHRGRDDTSGYRGSDERGSGFDRDDRFRGSFRDDHARDREYGGARSFGDDRGQGARDASHDDPRDQPGRQTSEWGMQLTGGDRVQVAGPGARTPGDPSSPRGPHHGKGPVGFQRSDERIKEMVCEALTDHGDIDASHVEITVKAGEVTLAGTIDDRRMKRLAEDCVEAVAGVKDVHNQLRVVEHKATADKHDKATDKAEHPDKKHRAS